eukprot:8720809-Pyramimonas_sp.AAC.1
MEDGRALWAGGRREDEEDMRWKKRRGEWFCFSSNRSLGPKGYPSTASHRREKSEAMSSPEEAQALARANSVLETVRQVTEHMAVSQDPSQ